MKLLIALQSLTFVVAAGLFFQQGNWRLGTAQLLLAVVNTVVYM